MKSALNHLATPLSLADFLQLARSSTPPPVCLVTTPASSASSSVRLSSSSPITNSTSIATNSHPPVAIWYHDPVHGARSYHANTRADDHRERTVRGTNTLRFISRILRAKEASPSLGSLRLGLRSPRRQHNRQA
ncbi:hypothetical protein HD554DRAFT_2137438 [Boletus coccyginus]|nr:hypothetical protein HD554DRAFT_2137438 [Boletus coccyginus]